MVSFLSSLALLAVLPNVADAATLQVKWTGPGASQPVSLTFEDVKPGPLPGLMALGPWGSELIVHLDLKLLDTPVGEPHQVQVDAEIKELATKGTRGRAFLKTISSPRIVTFAGQQGRIRQGSRRPIEGTNPVQYEEFALTLEFTYFDETAPAETAAAAP